MRNKVIIANLNLKIKLQQIFNNFIQDETREQEKQDKLRKRAEQLDRANTTRFNIDKQRLTIAQNQGDLLNEAVFKAEESIIQEQFKANQLKEQAGNLAKGNAELIKQTALADLNNRKQRELNTLTEKNTREREKANNLLIQAQELRDDLKNEVRLLSVAGSLEERKLRARIKYSQTIKQINSLEDKTFEVEQKRDAARILSTELAQADLDNQKEIANAIRRTIEPLQNIRRENEANLKTNKEYNRLLLEGMLPSEAKRITEFNKQADLLRSQLDTKIAIVEANILDAQVAKQTTTEYQEQLDRLKEQRQALEGEAAKGPGGTARTDQDIIEDRVAQLQGELTELTQLGNIAVRVADNIGAAFGTAFQDIVSVSKDGTITA